jgi:hypothetical protein
MKPSASSPTKSVTSARPLSEPQPARNVLLLTATIAPKPGQPDLQIVDATQRLQDYATALSFYQGLLDQDVLNAIVFAENSGFDLASLRARFQHPGIEWISHYDLDYPQHFHRGYGESRLIDHAMAHSLVLGSLAANDVVWKVSGRYVVTNLGRLVCRRAQGGEFHAIRRRDWVEMSVMAWTIRGYQAFMFDLWRHLQTPRAPELILAEIVDSRQAGDAMRCQGFRWPIRIVGRRGSNASSFQGRLTDFRIGLESAFWTLMRPFENH